MEAIKKEIQAYRKRVNILAIIGVFSVIADVLDGTNNYFWIRALGQLIVILILFSDLKTINNISREVEDNE